MVTFVEQFLATRNACFHDVEHILVDDELVVGTLSQPVHVAHVVVAADTFKIEGASSLHIHSKASRKHTQTKQLSVCKSSKTWFVYVLGFIGMPVAALACDTVSVIEVMKFVAHVCGCVSRTTAHMCLRL